MMINIQLQAPFENIYSLEMEVLNHKNLTKFEKNCQ